MKKLIFNIIIIVLLFQGCETTGPDRNAVKLTIDELKATPGYEWFDTEYNKYTPDPLIISQIISAYKNNQFYLYVNPTCACIGTYNLFPSIVKCLKSANIPESNINIYSMLDAGYNHSMMDKFTVKSLPQCFTNNFNYYYSVVDSMDYYLFKNPSDTSHIIEKMILKSLK